MRACSAIRPINKCVFCDYTHKCTIYYVIGGLIRFALTRESIYDLFASSLGAYRVAWPRQQLGSICVECASHFFVAACGWGLKPLSG